MASTVLRWSHGVSKLVRTKTVSFGLPADRAADGFVVCPQAGGCKGLCYAKQGRYGMPEAIQTRETNLAIVRASLALFERLAIEDLAHIAARSIRVHDSGDFFSQAYLDSWFAIMRAHPRKKFYAYSKSLHLDWLAKPDNFRVTFSVGGKLDHLIDRTQSHTRIFETHAARKAAGYGNGHETDTLAQRGAIRIGLVYHGTRTLTPAQRNWLRQED